MTHAAHHRRAAESRRLTRAIAPVPVEGDAGFGAAISRLGATPRWAKRDDHDPGDEDRT